MNALPSRRNLIEVVALHTCTRNCFGISGYASSCCKLEHRDFIQGPIRDADEVLKRLCERFRRDVPFDEVFIRFEEGASLFPERSTWQDSRNYPALRPTMDAATGYRCAFLGTDETCTIYEERPAMCRNYRCEHLAKVLDLL